MKPVAIIKPGSLPPKSKEALTKAGYVVVESNDLECVRIVNHVVLPVSDTMVWHAAMETLALGQSYSHFGRMLAGLAADASKGKP